ncbi:Acetylornithine deacetylase/Succinyl-diaminopimelate desuccinylase [Duganella sp. CF402]|uniref:M20/M25/M40 family metallo-hydrolase n=1 Tax=unclassified Duganella TaxID=2636909 RepID=UPI0008D4488C|nr:MULTISPECIES: M20/M25/M40 family metallo-hydrolase [unclassified Duganella]RZT07992.1 acetylornithine deacetylase/succinyl-diaminopimelate desuccinylase-like protein [Duganella sp. BK701]SEM09238.1 Acetylornithine deacetylase/Succinyl-diaminopimelate desuccinylase [Duganella sp. CF402]
MKSRFVLGAVTAMLACVQSAYAADPTEQQFRALYKELLETNTTLSSGSCTLAAERIAARLKTAGFPESDLHLFADPAHPKEGGLVAVLPGRDPKAKAILLLAHIDVVEAKREDWTRDPFTLIEEDGKFYARGVVDDKAQAAIWADSLIRFKQEGYKPRHTLKMALTCGEETSGAFNGAEWLTKNRRELIDAGYALNEGAGGELNAAGKRITMTVQAGEKVSQNYRLEVTNRGGHSSRPMKDNAIYHLAGALSKVQGYEFPIQLTDGSKGYLNAMAKIQLEAGHKEIADAMKTVVQNPQDAKAVATVSSADASWAAMLHTTCVATMLDAGHATNALPQRARANVNCRIFPGVTQETVRQALVNAINDPAVKVETLEIRGENSAPPPLTRAIMEPVEKLTAKMWPGVPVMPILQSGATDGQFLNAAGIPTYGISGIFLTPDLGNIHGLNEYIGVQSLMEGRVFLHELVKTYAEQN